MARFYLPYHKSQLTLELPDSLNIHILMPAEVHAVANPLQAVEHSLDNPVGEAALAQFAGAKSAAIAINDKTRPAPHDVLLPPLLQRLESLGIPPKQIKLIIATGTHAVMPPDEYPRIMPSSVIERYTVLCHDCDDDTNLSYLGETPRKTPVYINRAYMESDIRLVVGNIEPHQFQGFSGGVKSAAIGLAGRATINHNHSMMSDPNAQLGRFDDNPPRQDIEYMGRMIGIHFALNSILNRDKQIVQVISGDPYAVMHAGIPLARNLYETQVTAPFDMMIASPGGYPKDINLYQAQKALAHASLVTKEGGIIILVAACTEGTGSEKYEHWMHDGITSHADVLAKFEREGYRIGPHKAFQIARDAINHHLMTVSDLPYDFASHLLLNPVSSLDEAVLQALALLPADARIGIMPYANATMPVVDVAAEVMHD